MLDQDVTADNILPDKDTEKPFQDSHYNFGDGKFNHTVTGRSGDPPSKTKSVSRHLGWCRWTDLWWWRWVLLWLHLAPQGHHCCNTDTTKQARLQEAMSLVWLGTDGYCPADVAQDYKIRLNCFALSLPQELQNTIPCCQHTQEERASSNRHGLRGHSCHPRWAQVCASLLWSKDHCNQLLPHEDQCQICQHAGAQHTWKGSHGQTSVWESASQDLQQGQRHPLSLQDQKLAISTTLQTPESCWKMIPDRLKLL